MLHQLRPSSKTIYGLRDAFERQLASTRAEHAETVLLKKRLRQVCIHSLALAVWCLSLCHWDTLVLARRQSVTVLDSEVERLRTLLSSAFIISGIGGALKFVRRTKVAPSNRLIF